MRIRHAAGEAAHVAKSIEVLLGRHATRTACTTAERLVHETTKFPGPSGTGTREPQRECGADFINFRSSDA